MSEGIPQSGLEISRAFNLSDRNVSQVPHVLPCDSSRFQHSAASEFVIVELPLGPHIPVFLCSEKRIGIIGCGFMGLHYRNKNASVNREKNGLFLCLWREHILGSIWGV